MFKQASNSFILHVCFQAYLIADTSKVYRWQSQTNEIDSRRSFGEPVRDYMEDALLKMALKNHPFKYFVESLYHFQMEHATERISHK